MINIYSLQERINPRKKRIKKQLLKEQEQAKTQREKAKIQAKIVATEDAHPRQPRCQYFGEEIQMDACIHLWFGKTKTALHAAIDDATGQVVGLYFDKEETLNGILQHYTSNINKIRDTISNKNR